MTYFVLICYMYEKHVQVYPLCYRKLSKFSLFSSLLDPFCLYLYKKVHDPQRNKLYHLVPPSSTSAYTEILINLSGTMSANLLQINTFYSFCPCLTLSQAASFFCFPHLKVELSETDHKIIILTVALKHLFRNLEPKFKSCPFYQIQMTISNSCIRYRTV